MSKVLFLGIPSHGHVNPTLGLVHELIEAGEEVVYFASDAFREKIEGTGATFKSYSEDLDLFKSGRAGGGGGMMRPMEQLLLKADSIVDDILDKVSDERFDYLIHSVAFPFTRVIAQVLGLPTVSSLAIFLGMKGFLARTASPEKIPGSEGLLNAYHQAKQTIGAKYGVEMPDNIFHLLFNKGEINLIYTSEYFIPADERSWFDSSYKFVGPPIYKRRENLDFPFEQLRGKKVIYISLGTVFGNYNGGLYDLFFKTFGGQDLVVVMAAYNVDLSQADIPPNFIVRNYIPQTAVLAYANAAITHAGMNSISDLMDSEVPFVCLPLGADQPQLAKRAEELGATISLDVEGLTSEALRAAVEKVQEDPAYRANMQKISSSFKAAGGYKKAVEEIFAWKRHRMVGV